GARRRGGGPGPAGGGARRPAATAARPRARRVEDEPDGSVLGDEPADGAAVEADVGPAADGPRAERVLVGEGEEQRMSPVGVGHEDRGAALSPGLALQRDEQV